MKNNEYWVVEDKNGNIVALSPSCEDAMEKGIRASKYRCPPGEEHKIFRDYLMKDGWKISVKHLVEKEQS